MPPHPLVVNRSRATMQEFIGADYRLIRNSPCDGGARFYKNRYAAESMRARRAVAQSLNFRNAGTATRPRREHRRCGTEM